MARLPVVPDLGVYLREQRVAAQLSLRQLADRAGVSNPYLSQIERGLRKPSAEILGSLADALDLSAEALYVRAGILEAPPTRGAVEAAILADPALTDRQRRTLLDLYSLFAGEGDDEMAPAPPAPRDAVEPDPEPAAPTRPAAASNVRSLHRKETA